MVENNNCVLSREQPLLSLSKAHIVESSQSCAGWESISIDSCLNHSFECLRAGIIKLQPYKDSRRRKGDSRGRVLTEYRRSVIRKLAIDSGHPRQHSAA
jgi:hypothetical protein